MDLFACGYTYCLFWARSEPYFPNLCYSAAWVCFLISGFKHSIEESRDRQLLAWPGSCPSSSSSCLSSSKMPNPKDPFPIYALDSLFCMLRDTGKWLLTIHICYKSNRDFNPNALLLGLYSKEKGMILHWDLLWGSILWMKGLCRIYIIWTNVFPKLAQKTWQQQTCLVKHWVCPSCMFSGARGMILRKGVER